jgi:predicted lipoprotein with Yx(FWY)xxD motif
MRILTRTTAIGSIVAVSLLLLAACQYGGSGSTAPSSGDVEPLTINVTDTDAGRALTGDGGMTLYILNNDTDGTSTCTGGCATTWRPLLGEGSQVTAGSGVAGSFGTTTRDDGTRQVTHDGQPLYYYAGDSAAGDSTGEGVGGVWHIAPPGEGAAASQPAASQGEAPSATPYRAPYGY